jgi:small neutral amino acid transporter SnatA (MarC family)
MIFGETEVFRETPGGDPLIVPLAIPSIAGPSALATVLLLSGQEPERWPEWALSLFLAWISTTFILLLSERLVRLLGERVMSAIESLMGLILTAISVEMFLQGIKTVFCG